MVLGAETKHEDGKMMLKTPQLIIQLIELLDEKGTTHVAAPVVKPLPRKSVGVKEIDEHSFHHRYAIVSLLHLTGRARTDTTMASY